MYLILWCAIAAAALLLTPAKVQACHSDGDMGRKVHTRANVVSVDPNGVTQYDIAGMCIFDPQSSEGLAFSASGTWDPGQNQAVETASGPGAWHGKWSGPVLSTWTCPTDPWLSQGVMCGLLNGGDFQGRSGSPPNDRPFSASHGPADALRAQFAQKKPGPPALPPRDVKAVIRSPLPSGSRAHLSWGIPADQTSMHRTVGWFEVQRHPTDPPNAPWFAASGKLPATATGYADPDPLPTKTEYMVCAVNVNGRACSPPVPAVANLAEQLAMNPEKVRDQVLAQQVRDTLGQRFPKLAPKIETAASGGVVTLTGSVPTTLDKLAVGEATANIQGVSRVENQLEAAAAPPISSQPRLGIRPGVGTQMGPKRNP